MEYGASIIAPKQKERYFDGGDMWYLFHYTSRVPTQGPYLSTLPR